MAVHSAVRGPGDPTGVTPWRRPCPSRGTRSAPSFTPSSLAGSEDGLSTPQKIDDARPLLPPDADLVEIAGASHSSFGDYGLQPGDKWCLCAPRWQEALDAGHAPKVVLAATHEACLAFCDLEDLKAHAVDTD